MLAYGSQDIMIAGENGNIYMDNLYLDREERKRLRELETKRILERETARCAHLHDRLVLPAAFLLGRLPVELYAVALQFLDIGDVMFLEAAAGPRFFASRLPDLRTLGFAYCAARRIEHEHELAWIAEHQQSLTVRFLVEHEVDAFGVQRWMLNGKLHREGDLPAMVSSKCCKWFFEGKLHRDGDLPAIECTNGGREWWTNDLRHRDGDLPAVEHANGDCEWWINNQRHRDGDLPAVERVNGDREWYQNGRRIRILGRPTIVYANGTEAWTQSLASAVTGRLTETQLPNGDREWFIINDFNNRRIRHRCDDLPAVERADGRREWWYLGQRFREGDRPTAIRADGTMEWYDKKGRRHRPNGLPAIVWADGRLGWYVDGAKQRKPGNRRWWWWE